MIAQLPNLIAILRKHQINPKFDDEFRALVEDGVRPGDELRKRIAHVSNYTAALDEAMTELSKPLDRLFPSTTFESLDTEEFATR
ncbi:MAG: hypothetical protein ABFC88_12485 [Thermoguttaceae bacterium]